MSGSINEKQVSWMKYENDCYGRISSLSQNRTGLNEAYHRWFSRSPSFGFMVHTCVQRILMDLGATGITPVTMKLEREWKGRTLYQSQAMKMDEIKMFCLNHTDTIINYNISQLLNIIEKRKVCMSLEHLVYKSLLL